MLSIYNFIFVNLSRASNYTMPVELKIKEKLFFDMPKNSRSRKKVRSAKPEAPNVSLTYNCLIDFLPFARRISLAPNG